MIEKLKNGNTMITLGEGSVLMGQVSEKDGEKPFGIYITDLEQNPENTTIISLGSNKAIAAYMMAMVGFLESYVDDSSSPEILNALNLLRADLEPMMPKLAVTKQADSLKPNDREGRFKPGDRVVHMEYGAGTVKKNISNEYAEVYRVDYDKGSSSDSSEGLLSWEHKKKQEHVNQLPLF